MTGLACRCGACRLVLTGPPILAADCCCDSCRKAAQRLEALPGGQPMLGPQGQTGFVLYRKDRVALPAPAQMRGHRLRPGAPTRRVVAACCNTPLFLEFQNGHWLSLYASLWPPGSAPAPQLRTMVKDLPDPSALPDDIPNARTQSAGFMWALLKAWAGMGFRAPKLVIAEAADG